MVAVFVFMAQTASVFYLFAIGLIAAYIFYMLTVYKKAPDFKWILPLYLLGIGWQAIHFAEEYLYGYHTAMGIDESRFVISNMVAILFYCFAGVAIYLKIQGPQLIAIFFILFGGLGNAALHSFYFIKTGAYSPGFYTSLPFWLAPILLWWYWKYTRE